MSTKREKNGVDSFSTGDDVAVLGTKNDVHNHNRYLNIKDDDVAVLGTKGDDVAVLGTKDNVHKHHRYLNIKFCFFLVSSVQNF